MKTRACPPGDEMRASPAREERAITIIRAASEDAEKLAHIKQRVWLATYQSTECGINAGDILSKDFLCPERIEQRAAHLKENGQMHQTWVARESAQIVGYGRAVKGSAVNEIVTLYLLPEWQGRGIGSRLFRTALDWLGDEKDVALGVVPYNVGAITFYEKFGFRLGERVEHDESTFPTGKDLPEVEMLRSRPTT